MVRQCGKKPECLQKTTIDISLGTDRIRNRHSNKSLICCHEPAFILAMMMMKMIMMMMCNDDDYDDGDDDDDDGNDDVDND